MMWNCLVLASCLVASKPDVDTVVVCPPAFRSALQPWIDHRSAQGHSIQIVGNGGGADEIRRKIKGVARNGKLQYVVLIGDAEPGSSSDPRLGARCVPTFRVKTKVNVLEFSTPELATDNPYADLDDDGRPDLAVGRIPADSATEVAVILGKVIKYETKRGRGDWTRRVNFVAGIGGFGPLIDPILETATRKILTDDIPPDYQTSMTYGNWRSPFCPSPFRFHQATVDRLNEGCLFWVYIGHGLPYQLDRVQVVDRSYHIFNTADVMKLENGRGASVAVFLACFTGAFDQPYDCLAEQMVKRPGGPVAVLAGSRVTMPYGMTIMGKGLMDAYFRQHLATLGEVMLESKRQLVSTESSSTNRKLIDLVATLLSPKPRMLSEERLEHLRLFNLLGDPLMRLFYPQTLRLKTDAQIEAGSYLEVRGSTPLAGKCTIELVCRRDMLRFQKPSRRTFDRTPSEQVKYDAVYALANDHRWTTRTVALKTGSFLTALQVPPLARGPCHVRAFLETADGQRFAMGATNIEILAPESTTKPVQTRLQDGPDSAKPPKRSTDGKGNSADSDGSGPDGPSFESDF